MIPEKMTLNELRNKKAKEYYDRSRDKYGVPTKTLAESYLSAADDYGPQELDEYNVWYKAHWNRVLSKDQQVVWADGAYDDLRTCWECGTKCKMNAPTHPDHYKEIKVSLKKEKSPDVE